MDRTTQIVSLIVVLLTSLSGFGQENRKPVSKGFKVYPVYYVQGLEVTTDSSGQDIYGWLKSEDRTAVFSGDSTMLAGISSALIDRRTPENSFGEMTILDPGNQAIDTALFNQEMTLDEIDELEDFDGFDPEWIGMDSLDFEGSAIVPTVDSLALEIVNSDTLEVAALPSNSLLTGSINIEPVEKNVEREVLGVDSLKLLPEEMLQEIIVPEESSVEPPKIDLDNTNESNDPSTSKSNMGELPQPDPEQVKVQEKVSLPVESQQEIKVEQSTPATGKTNAESSVKQKAEASNVAKADSNSKTKSNSEEAYSGEYAGLPQSERERQIRLDAEHRRRMEKEQQEIEKLKLEAQIKSENASNTVVGSKQETPEKGQVDAEHFWTKKEDSPPPKANVAVIAKGPIENNDEAPRDSVVVVQRDSLTLKAVSDIVARMDEVAVKDSVFRATERQRIDDRFDQMENKIDTMLNALGKQVILDKNVFSVPKEKFDIYFDINSYSIKSRQLAELEDYLSQLKDLSGFRIVLSGYADNSGDSEYNKYLVEKRIAAVKEAISSRGVAPAELLTHNYGKQKANSDKTYNRVDRKVSIQIFAMD